MKRHIYFFSILVLLGFNAFSQELIPFSYNGRCGYINSEFNIVIEPRFTHAGHFSSEGFAIVYTINYYGRIPSRKDYIINRSGVIIMTANPAIRHVYGDLYSLNIFPENEAVIIKLKDNKIIARHAGGYAASDDGYFLAAFTYEEKRYYFIDFDGNKVLTHLNMNRESASFFEQRARITNEDWKPQIIDMEGNVVGNITFSLLGQRYAEGLIPAKSKDGITGYVDRSGSFAFTVPFLSDNGIPEATNFSGGYAAIRISRNPSVWKVINAQGRIVSENILVNDMWDFSDGLSLVSIYNFENKENKYGYVNTKGEYLIRPILESADNFKNGYARIVYNGREGLLKPNGKVIWSSDIIQGSPAEKELK
jgi:hypothetical protein